MATIKDIAKMAKVSTSTVSHVLNKTRYVSDAISERVMLATKQLNYAPSAVARSLKLNHTKTLGMLVTTSTNPFFGEVVKGVERCCYQQGYNLIFCNSEGDEKRVLHNIEMLLQKRVDGLMIMCSEISPLVSALFERYQSIPIVMMDWGIINFECDKIQDNSYAGGYIATQYLIEQGHKDIGCLTGPLENMQSLKRFDGFKAAMLDAKLTINYDWVASGNFECEGGIQAFEEIYARGTIPSALFVSNDMMAMGVFSAAHKHNINIPNQLSIIGYDDIQLAKYLVPPLTTIHQPKYRLGAKAVELLLDKINKKSTSFSVVNLDTTLVIRNSVKIL